jgi:hypothetical protein
MQRFCTRRGRNHKYQMRFAQYQVKKLKHGHLPSLGEGWLRH